IGAQNIRVYSRYEGLLSQVLKIVESDLRYMADQADVYDLYFDCEQHEELKSSDIVHVLRQINHPRIHALFDFGNMINADERPLEALRGLAPYIRQSHLKGVRIVPELHGFGHQGVNQGSDQDDLPSPRLLCELLMLGDHEPQVTVFSLEQENHYSAPAFRHSDEDPDPFIPYRDMSDTPLPPGYSVEQMLSEE
ncbi:xylose isomerase, partial [Cryobacterium sp. MLB-32]